MQMSRSGTTCFSFFFSKRSPPQKQFPEAYLCPITGYPMADPVNIPTGEIFDRTSIDACRELNFIPPSLSSSSINFSSPTFFLSPNLNLKAEILEWCNSAGLEPPRPISIQAVCGTLQTAMAFGIHHYQYNANCSNQESSQLTISGRGEKKLPPSSPSTVNGKGVADLLLEGILKNLKMAETPLKKLSSGDYHESNPSSPPPPLHTQTDSLEMKILKKLKKSKVDEVESALTTLIEVANESPDRRVSLCTQRIMDALIPLLRSSYISIQINATGAIYMFSLSPSNRIKIVQWASIPPLLDVLINGVLQARDRAATAIYNLAIREQNRTVIGASGAIPPLLDRFCQHYSSNIPRREEAGLALCYLVLSQDNLNILANIRAVPQLLLDVTSQSRSNAEGEIALKRCAMIMLCHLAGTCIGRQDLLEADIVRVMMYMVRRGEGLDVYCLAILYSVCVHDYGAFKRLAVAAGGLSVLAKEKEEWGGDGGDLARRMLKIIGGGYMKEPMRSVPRLPEIEELTPEQQQQKQHLERQQQILQQARAETAYVRRTEHRLRIRK